MTVKRPGIRWIICIDRKSHGLHGRHENRIAHGAIEWRAVDPCHLEVVAARPFTSIVRLSTVRMRGAAARADESGRPSRPSATAHAVPDRLVLRFMSNAFIKRAARGARLIRSRMKERVRTASGARWLKWRRKRQTIDLQGLWSAETHALPQGYSLKVHDACQFHAASHGAQPHHGAGHLMVGGAMVAISSSSRAIMGLHHHGVGCRGAVRSTCKSRRLACRRKDGHQHEQQHGEEPGEHWTHF